MNFAPVYQGPPLADPPPANRVGGGGYRPPGRTRADFSKWCRCEDLNPEPSAYEAAALPLCYTGDG